MLYFGSAATVAIMRMELDAAGLRAAAHSKDVAVSGRLLALALVLEGSTRTEAAHSAGMDRQTLRDWAHRYNARDRRAERRARGGGSSALLEEQLAELKVLVLAGPDLAHDGVVRWRCVDRRSVIGKRYDAVLHEPTVSNLLRRIGMTRVQPWTRRSQRSATLMAGQAWARSVDQAGRPPTL
jgi:transposase